MSTTNKDLVGEAIRAIPLWRAFLDQKEAEQKALLEEVRQGGDSPPESKPTQLIKSLRARFGSQTEEEATPQEVLPLPTADSEHLPPDKNEAATSSEAISEEAVSEEVISEEAISEEIPVPNEPMTTVTEDGPSKELETEAPSDDEETEETEENEDDDDYEFSDLF